MSQREQRKITPEDSGATPKRGVGDTLRDARKRRGLSIEAAAGNLRIRPAVLEAMEAGEFEKLPNGAYAIGFLRSYADFVGLDRDEIVRRVKAEAAALGARTELIFPKPMAESRLPSGAIMLASLLLACGAYAVWYYQTSGDRRPVARVEPVPAQLAPANSPRQAEAATALPATPSPAPPAVVSAAPPVTATQPPAAQIAAAPASPSPAETSQMASLPAGVDARQYGEASGARIVIKATGDSWLQVRDASGAIVFSRIMRSGDSYGAPVQPGLVFATGSAGMLDIMVDGKKAPPVGRPGFIRRDVPLDPERLLAGTAVVDPPAPVIPAAPADRPSDG